MSNSAPVIQSPLKVETDEFVKAVDSLVEEMYKQHVNSLSAESGSSSGLLYHYEDLPPVNDLATVDQIICELGKVSYLMFLLDDIFENGVEQLEPIRPIRVDSESKRENFKKHLQEQVELWLIPFPSGVQFAINQLEERN